jgi:Glycosyl transferase family 8
LHPDSIETLQEPPPSNAPPLPAADPEAPATSLPENEALADNKPATSLNSAPSVSSTPETDNSPPSSPPPARPRNAIVTAVWGANYASFALMLGWSLQQHNPNLTQVAELVLLTLDDPSRAIGLTPENITRLDKVGWKIRVAEKLNVPGVDTEQIMEHRRLNLNKLQQFGWAEYEKIVYIDADVVCKGSISDLFLLPGPFAATPDVWPEMPIDTGFNSGVMVFNPSVELYEDMIEQLPKIHDPHEGDQNFLQQYWKYRNYMLPFKYNLNIVMHASYRETFNRLWDEAVLVHYTVYKPSPDPSAWCVKSETGIEDQHGECIVWPVVTVSVPSKVCRDFELTV